MPILSLFFKIAMACVLSQILAKDWLADNGWWATWVGMAGLILIASRSSPRESLLLGLITGILALGRSFWWAQEMLAYVMNDEGTLPKALFILLILMESSIFLIFAVSIAKIRQLHPNSVGLLLPISVWIVIEAYMPRLFRWALGHTQFGNPYIVQIADLGGPSLISATILAAAAIPMLFIDWQYCPNRQTNARRGLICCILLVISAMTYGALQVHGLDITQGPELRVGVVQEDPAERAGLGKMLNWSLAMGPVDLLVWPESALGVHSTELDSFNDVDQVMELSEPPMINPEPLAELPAPVIVGGRSFSGPRELEHPIHQTAFLIGSRGEIIERYHKRILMPLGEYVPGEQMFPRLHNWFQMSETFLPGNSDQPLKLPTGQRIGVIICYEDTMSEITRRTVAAGAQILACIINDSAFASPIALQQHFQLARLRAIENRRYFIRSAGGGITCIVDPLGRVKQSLPVHEAGALHDSLYLRDDTTLFQLLGNWPPLLASAIILLHLLRSRKLIPRNAPDPTRMI